MRPNRVKRALRDGGVAFGTMVFEFGTTGIGQIAAAAGADFAIFDLEHSGWSIETIRSLMATSRAAELVPMVRVPAIQYHLLSRPLDVGAMGLMAPMVESAEQARLMVWSAKYPPLGRRGAAFGVAHDDYAGGDVVAKMTIANEEVMLIAQIETAVDWIRSSESRRSTGSTWSGSATGTSPYRSVYQASSITRPTWLRSRGSSPRPKRMGRWQASW
jgi:2-keto-3-deoxy-L-rhamnonate aldolase RhmA